jgi:hypothetical protein
MGQKGWSWHFGCLFSLLRFFLGKQKEMKKLDNKFK